jgi:WD40 repeat protein
MWEAASGREVFAAKEHLRRVTEVAFTPDGKTLASASQDRTVCLWHVASGRSLCILRGHTGMLSALALTPDGNTIVSGDSDGGLLWWRAPEWPRITASAR